MTAGSEALREAARQEAAMFYSRPLGDDSIGARALRRLSDELEVAQARGRARLAREADVIGLIELYGMTRTEARAYVRAHGGRTAA